MTNTIDTFKSRITEGGGLAMANLYRVFLPPIIGVRTEDMDILCKVYTNTQKDKYFRQKDLWV